MRGSAFRAALGALYVVSFVAIGLILGRGASFYLTPVGERAHHPGYWDWKSGGRVGHGLGIVGSTMMVLMLGYSLRKRVRGLRRLGALGRWLDVHIFLGIIGPLLVVLHSAFKVHGLVALSFWSMIAVAASGVLGRYLYLQIPRNRADEELTLTELEKLDRTLSERLRTEFRLDERLLARLEALSSPPAAHRGLLAGLAGIVVGGFTQRRRLHAFARECRPGHAPLFRQFELVVREKALSHRRVLLWNRVHELFHYWHVIHKPFAVVMYLFMLVHVIVALMTGYGGLGFS